MNEQPNQQKNAEPKIFNTINAVTLLEQEFEPLQFAVDKILPQGLFIFAGNGKIGKSWLALDICTTVSSGGKFWDFDCVQGDVLYLALEDNHRRLHDRLKKIEAGGIDVSRFHLTTASLGINNGLIEQALNFLSAYPDTRFIVIDTLERIRDSEQDKSMYSCDYRDMTKLREITDRHNVTLMLIHHTRKMHDPDPLNMLSGSTGLVGSVDGVFVLDKVKRIGKKAKLTIANRDTESFCFKVELDAEKCKWLFMGNDDDVSVEDEPLCQLTVDFMKDKTNWKGTATELCEEFKAIDDKFSGMPNDVAKRMRKLDEFFKSACGVEMTFCREHNGKFIEMQRTEDQP